MLDLIPEEILLVIIDKIAHKRDLSSFSQVSKKFYGLALPTLYESITIKAQDEDNLQQTDVQKFLRTTRQHYLAHVKDLGFWAPIQTKDQFRCIHYTQERDIYETEGEVGGFHSEEYVMSKLDDLGELMPEIRPLFDRLEDGQLTSFRWHLGTCIPQYLLGPGGYLPTKQTRIEDLSLIIGDPCVLPKEDMRFPIQLNTFTSLKSFSWSGGLSQEYFGALHDMFFTPSIAQNLECLKLDLIDWWDARWNWCGQEGDLQQWILTNNFFTERVLGLVPGGEMKIMFPSLKKLVLSSLQFKSWGKSIATVFNISKLHSLNLRGCPHAGSLLKAVVESGEPVCLRELELVIHHDKESPDRYEQDSQCIETFLFSFQGLEKLRLLVQNIRDVAASHRYWAPLMHHKQTLAELVYHERSFNYEWLDCGIPVAKPEVVKLFEELNLQSLAMCIAPIQSTTETRALIAQIYADLSHEQRTKLKFLHCRTTLYSNYENYLHDANKNHHYFVGWAFATFPSLKMILFGDFSYGQENETQEVFYRTPPEERAVEEQLAGLEISANGDEEGVDNEYKEFEKLKKGEGNLDVEAYMEQWKDVYEACPVEPLYRKDF